MKDVLTVIIVALACFGVLLLWPAPYEAMPDETIAGPAPVQPAG